MSKFRRSGSFNLSPKKNFPTPVSVSTPTGRRQSFTTPSNALILLDGPGNNDEAEKRERQLNRLQQLQSRNVHSPSGTSIDRRKSLNTFAGLTNQQITEHYAKCIQLSAENKINVKNAFNLQLIDYMTELLKRKDSDMNNFQVASCTLDASTKIYGYRVDCVHTDTLKMAGGLGRTKEQAEDDLGEFKDGELNPKGKKRVKTKRCVTVETNLKNLNVAHFDLEFDVDPLFKKTASQFDEGRIGGGQFMNTLQILNDTCQLILDSNTVLDCGRDIEESQSKNITLPPITDSVKLISPTFASFEFTSWKLGEGNNTFFNNPLDSNENEHAFDINAIPDPLEEPDNFDAEDVYDEVAYDEETGLSNKTVITLGGGACRQEPCPPPQLEIVHLKEHLANTLLEYSYFDTRVMSAWAGPGHWKLKPLVRGSDSHKLQKPKERQKKEFTLNYNENSEIEHHFSVGKNTNLSQTTVKKWSSNNTTLPPDLHYDPSKLSKLYMREGIVIRRQAVEMDQENEDINEKGFEKNTDNDPDMDLSSNYGDNTAPGYDDTDIFSQTAPPAQLTQEELEEKNKDFLGNNLVEAPNKVLLLNIGYARTAKKIDMKKLKSSIWLLLSESENKENERNVEGNLKNCNKKEFSNLYSDLGPRLPSKMTENLSVPLAFIALLHLANENCLKLTSSEDLGDFVISQG